jgi:hypothetical protein
MILLKNNARKIEFLVSHNKAFFIRRFKENSYLPRHGIDTITSYDAIAPLITSFTARKYR